MDEQTQKAIDEAMRRANPDVPGDLMRHLQDLSPEAAAIIRSLQAQLPKK